MIRAESGKSEKESEIFNQATLSLIADAYELAELHFISSPTEGVITDNAILEDVDGRRFFAKLYPREEMEKHARSYRAAELVAVDSRIPVTVPLIPKNWSYTVTINNKSLALFPYIEHSKKRPDWSGIVELTAGMGKCLGQMHAVPITDKGSDLQIVDRWSAEGALHLIKILGDIQNLISKKTTLDELDQAALYAVSQKLDTLKQKSMTNNQEVELRVCHGDLHGHNILYGDQMEIVAILDWDNAGLSDPFVDFFNTFLMQVVGRDVGKFDETKEELATAFVKNYLDGRKLNPSTIDMAAVRTAYDTLMMERIGTSWPMDQHYFENDTRNDERLPILIDKMNSVTVHYEQIWDFVQRIFQNQR